MKNQRFVLLQLMLIVGLLLTGCAPSRGPVSETQAADQSVPPAEAVTPPAQQSLPASATAMPTTTPGAPGIQSQPAIELTPAPVAPSEESSRELLPPLSRTTNILLLGSDRRPGEVNWRTDVLMLIALDLQEKQAGVISLPRDIYIDEIPGHKPNKINVIDYLGEQDEPGNGPRLLASILEEKIGVPVHFFLHFEFEGFKEVIDALGGVEISVECRVYEYLPEEDINLYLEPGIHRLAGKVALAYVRARNQGGDLERARRQQRVVWAVRNQLLNENQLANVPALYAALQGSAQTDIGFMDAIRFARFGLHLAEDDIHGMVISPPEMVKSGWRGGMSVWVADWPLIAQRVQTVFDRPPLLQTNTVGAEGDRVRCP